MILTDAFQEVRVDHKANSEKPLVFVSVILPKTTGVQMVKDICMQLMQQMNLWNHGCYAALINDTEAEALGRAGTSPEHDNETCTRAFNA